MHVLGGGRGAVMNQLHFFPEVRLFKKYLWWAYYVSDTLVGASIGNIMVCLVAPW